MNPQPPNTRLPAVIASLALLVAAVLWSYWGVRHNQFFAIDDPAYITANTRVQQGLTIENVKWAFTTFDVANWHPLTWLSHMLDWQLFGADAGGHHMMSAALHALNALLVLAALGTLTRSYWLAFAGALVWAVHPLRVESVAWAAERKDVLSACFGLLCLIAYAHYANRPSIVRYCLVVVALALGLLAKPMLVTWPFVMLLLDFWPLRRIANTTGDSAANDGVERRPLRWIVLEKLPLMFMAAAASAVTVIAQRRSGAVSDTNEVEFGQRLGNAATSYVRYLGDTFWPTRLAGHYPHPLHWPLMTALGAAALLTIVCVAAWCLRRRWPWLTVGWLWFLGTLVPVIGLVQVGSQSMADRYTYLPHIGLLLAIVWSAAALLRPWRGSMPLLVAMAAILLCMLTQQQVGYWRTSKTMYERTLAVAPDNSMIHRNMANLARESGDAVAEERHLNELARIEPGNALMLATVADFHVRQGRFDKAVAVLNEAVRSEPDQPDALNNLSWLLAMAPDSRVRDPARALELALHLCAIADQAAPEYSGYLDTLATAYAANGRLEDALLIAQRAREFAVRHNQADLVRDIDARLAELRRLMAPK